MMSTGATNPLLQNYEPVEILHSVALDLLHSIPPAMDVDNPDVPWDTRLPGLVKER